MAHELEVWLFADRVGTLALIDGRLTFWYSPVWLSRPDARALSLSLPLQAEPFGDHRARPFFAGLLPEGQMRRLIAQQIQVSRQNDFALLDHIGGECAGAVTLLAPGRSLHLPARDDDVQWLTDNEVVSILDELPRRPMLAGTGDLRLSLAGAQDKLPVVFDGFRLGLPINGAPSSHILKPPIREVDGSVVNEGFCMALAGAMGIPTARSAIHVVMDRSFLLVERYDRFIDARGQRHRLHQEDFCQALGVVPEAKYQSEGGPSLGQCFGLIRQATRPNAPQVLRLLDGVIFNALIGNHDAHAKNFSLLYSGRSPVLAPLYDTLSTAVYPTLTPKMAMKIGSKYKFSEVQQQHWIQFAENAGFTAAQAQRRIVEIARSLPPAARKVRASSGSVFSESEVVEKIVALIVRRCSLTIGRVASAAPESDATANPSVEGDQPGPT